MAIFSLGGLGVLGLSCSPLMAQSSYWGADNGDGSYTNPIILGDYPDPDIIRVGSDYYMVNSSFVSMPGIPICHSKDLINWTIIGHAYQQLTHLPEFSLEGEKSSYGSVSWAPTIKYHKGTFYIGVNSPGVGFIMFKSQKPEGPYTMHAYGKNMQDPGFFVDDDDRMYLAHGIEKIYLTACNEDATGLKEGQEDKLIITPPKELAWIFEGCHMYKLNGWYYVFNTCHGHDGKQTVSRSRHLEGPYETRLIIKDYINYPRSGVHQGGMIDTEAGEYWAYTFQDRNYMGRDLMYYPMRWEDGWPVVGVKGRETKGVVTHRKPDLKPVPPAPCAEKRDDFADDKLKLEWHFNHVPMSSHWSLTDRPGFLRIRAQAASSWVLARNTLMQKVAGPAGSATTKVDVSQLKPGDLGGLVMFAKPYSMLAVLNEGGKRMLQMRLAEMDEDETGEMITIPAGVGGRFRVGNEVVKESVEIPTDELYLRVKITKRGTALYSYSFDNALYTDIGVESAPNYWLFMGIRYGLFCYNTTKSADADCGWIDFDDFSMTCSRQGNRYDAREWVDFSQYDDQMGCNPVRPVIGRPMVHLNQMTQGAWLQFNQLQGLAACKLVTLRYKSPQQAGCVVELRKDALDGPVLLRADLPMGGNAQNWCEKSYALPDNMGLSKLFFLIKGDPDGVELQSFKFE